MTRSAWRPLTGAYPAPTSDDPGQLTAADDGPRVCECALAATPDAVRAAREFTRNTLRRWKRDELLDDAALVASELVTNALLHGVRDAVAGNGAGDGEYPILLQLVHQTSSVLCIVRDPSSTPPHIAGGDVLDENHRGLRIVAEVSTAWGWTPCEGHGKTVWSVLDAEPQPFSALAVDNATSTAMNVPHSHPAPRWSGSDAAPAPSGY